MPRPADYVSFAPSIFGLLPKPRKAVLTEGEFVFGKELHVSPALFRELGETLGKFGVECVVDGDNPAVSAHNDASIAPEGFRIEITPGRISVAFSDDSGRRYALSALEQLLYLAFRFGADSALLECGVVEDAPCLKWRGVMLDSARHFQSADTICRLLKAMGRLRLNRFHWHLTDCQGWRIPSASAPELNTLSALQEGCYTVSDIERIRRVALENGISIIPEIDFPGHNQGLLSLHPELRCHPELLPNEICLGNPASLEFAKARYAEAMALFPESKYFHIGGDEAWDGEWRACTKCQAKIQELGLGSARELEAWFMRTLSEFLIDNGRTPISWRTPAILTPQNILQCWGNANDMWGCAMHDQGKNLVISSIDNAYYLDYPQSAGEPRLQWMVMLPEEGIYAANPAAHMGEALGDRLLGLECPLWTEIVPEWRIGAKCFPRLVAASEAAWLPFDKKNYQDYLGRRTALELAGLEWW